MKFGLPALFAFVLLFMIQSNEHWLLFPIAYIYIYINDILNGNGVFARAGEELFNDYWANFGRIKIPHKNGNYNAVSSFSDYLQYRGLSENFCNPRKPRK